MKKLSLTFCILSLALLFASCGVPNNRQMDIYLGKTAELKLLHLNASSQRRIAQMDGVELAINDSFATDKPMELFAFYPDYTIVIDNKEKAMQTRVVLDINFDKVEFYNIDADGNTDGIIYRSSMSATDFKTHIHAEE